MRATNAISIFGIFFVDLIANFFFPYLTSYKNY